MIRFSCKYYTGQKTDIVSNGLAYFGIASGRNFLCCLPSSSSETEATESVALAFMITTLSRTTHSILTFSMQTIGMRTVSIMTIGITTVSIVVLIVTLSKCDSQQ
jgi:hypothetical protein